MPPCLNTALWKQSSNTCNYLKNGTNNTWYTVGLGYHSSLRWCDAFRNCYGSNDLRNRGRRDFDFYFRFHQLLQQKYPVIYLTHGSRSITFVAVVTSLLLMWFGATLNQNLMVCLGSMSVSKQIRTYSTLNPISILNCYQLTVLGNGRGRCAVAETLT